MVFGQCHVPDCYVRGVYNSYIACVGWNRLIVLIDPIINRLSLDYVARINVLSVVRNTVARNTEVVSVFRHRVAFQRAIARMRQADAAAPIRACDVVHKCVVTRRVYVGPRTEDYTIPTVVRCVVLCKRVVT